MQQSWSEESVKNALTAFRIGEGSIRIISKRYEVRLTALFRTIKGLDPNVLKRKIW